MSRVGVLVGLLGVVALAGVATYASSRVDVVAAGPVRNVAPPSERVRVEVLNAGGVAGRARSATLRLRDLGFDVVHFGNAARFDRDSSSVVDRIGRPALARAVADALGVQQVLTDPDPNLFVDVTVLLGTEWTPASHAEAVGDSVLQRELWDPRGWIGR